MIYFNQPLTTIMFAVVHYVALPFKYPIYTNIKFMISCFLVVLISLSFTYPDKFLYFSDFL